MPFSFFGGAGGNENPSSSGFDKLSHAAAFGELARADDKKTMGTSWCALCRPQLRSATDLRAASHDPMVLGSMKTESSALRLNQQWCGAWQSGIALPVPDPSATAVESVAARLTKNVVILVLPLGPNGLRHRALMFPIWLCNKPGFFCRFCSRQCLNQRTSLTSE